MVLFWWFSNAVSTFTSLESSVLLLLLQSNCKTEKKSYFQIHLKKTDARSNPVSKPQSMTKEAPNCLPSAHDLSWLLGLHPHLISSHSCYFRCDGLLVSIVGTIGFVGNTLALIVLSRPSLRDVFHQLLFALACFDTLYIVCGGINYTFR